MKSLTLLTTLFISYFSNSFAQIYPNFISDSLDVYVERALERWQIPGAAVLVIKDGKVVVSKGYGVKELGNSEKVNENTLFMIGSNTKAFTGTALAWLEYEGKLKLEDKVVKYLPNFSMKDSCVTKELNLVDIITHRMGYQTFQGDFMYWTSDLSMDEVIEKFGRVTPKYEFRTKYGYTNAGYAVAGKIIEKVSGLNWAEFLREKIFLPLQMTRTLALSEEFFKADNIAKPHSFVNGITSILEFKSIDNLAPCGSMSSSINDLSKWLIAQLDSGKLNEKNIIPYKVLQRTRKPETIQGRVKRPFNTSHFNLYGLGWGISDYEGKEIIAHTGGVNGFVTSVTLLPEINLGIVVLTNTDQNLFYQSLKWEIIDSFLGLPYRNYDLFFYNDFLKNKENNEKWLRAVKDSVQMNIQSEIPINKFQGKYENDVYGFANIDFEEGQLTLTLEHHSKLKGKLDYVGNNRFLCTYSDPTYGIKILPFTVSGEKVDYFELYVDDFIETLPYKFVKK